jgi:hypothetical protein
VFVGHGQHACIRLIVPRVFTSNALLNPIDGADLPARRAHKKAGRRAIARQAPVMGSILKVQGRILSVDYIDAFPIILLLLSACRALLGSTS